MIKRHLNLLFFVFYVFCIYFPTLQTEKECNEHPAPIIQISTFHHECWRKQNSLRLIWKTSWQHVRPSWHKSCETWINEIDRSKNKLKQKKLSNSVLPRIILYPSTSVSLVIFWLDSSTLGSATGVTQIFGAHISGSRNSTWKKTSITTFTLFPLNS